MEELNQPQASFLITRMLDEMVALIVSMWEVRDGGIEKLNLSYEGENPVSRLEFVEKNFDAYKHIAVKEFLVNLGSYLSELLRVFTLEGIGEHGILDEFLTKNVDDIHYVGSVIHRIEEIARVKNYLQTDFH